MSHNNTPAKGLVHRVAATLGESEIECPHCHCRFACPDTLANRLMVAYDEIRDGGEPIFTRKYNPDTGEMAMRVDHPEKGPIWRIMQATGNVYWDTRPTLPWPEMQTPGLEG